MGPLMESQTTELFDEDRDIGRDEARDIGLVGGSSDTSEAADKLRSNGASCTRSQMSPSFQKMRRPSSRPWDDSPSSKVNVILSPSTLALYTSPSGPVILVSSVEIVTLVDSPPDPRGPVHAPANPRRPVKGFPTELGVDDRENDKGMTAVPIDVDEDDRDTADAGLESLLSMPVRSRHGAGLRGGVTFSDNRGAPMTAMPVAHRVSRIFWRSCLRRSAVLHVRPPISGFFRLGSFMAGAESFEILRLSSRQVPEAGLPHALRPRMAPSDVARFAIANRTA